MRQCSIRQRAKFANYIACMEHYRAVDRPHGYPSAEEHIRISAKSGDRGRVPSRLLFHKLVLGGYTLLVKKNQL